jgi:hypothetical protein
VNGPARKKALAANRFGHHRPDGDAILSSEVNRVRPKQVMRMPVVEIHQVPKGSLGKRRRLA